MSRCVLKNKSQSQSQTLVVGLDPVFSSWFGQVFDDEDEIVAEVDTRSQSVLMDFIITHGGDLDDPYTREVYGYVAMDLDPGEVSRQ